MHYSIFAILIILLPLAFSCSTAPEGNTSMSLEEKYFEDYASPLRKWGFVNMDGKVVVEAKYDDVRSFSNGLAAVNYKGKWGFIDRNGQWIIDPTYMNVDNFDFPITAVRSFDGSYFLINRIGNRVSDQSFDEVRMFEDSLFVYRLDDSWGVGRIGGQMLTDPVYDKIQPMRPGMLLYTLREEVFVGDIRGRKVVDIVFDQLGSFNSNLFSARVDSSWAVYTYNGSQVLNFDNLIIKGLGAGVIIVSGPDGYYIADLDGEVLSAYYQYIFPMGHNRFAGIEGNRQYLLDSEGRRLSAGYTAINPFSSHYAAFRSGEYWGYMDTLGQEVIDPIFVLPWPFKGPYARTLTRTGICFINKMGQIITCPKTNDLRDLSEGLAAFQE